MVQLSKATPKKNCHRIYKSTNNSVMYIQQSHSEAVYILSSQCVKTWKCSRNKHIASTTSFCDVFYLGKLNTAQGNRVSLFEQNGCLLVGIYWSINSSVAIFCGSLWDWHTHVIYWWFQNTPEPYNANEVISLPVYYSPERDRIVTRVDVPCGGNQSQWLQCGAAIFLHSQ